MFDLKARRSHANKAKLNRDNIIYDIIYISVWLVTIIFNLILHSPPSRSVSGSTTDYLPSVLRPPRGCAYVLTCVTCCPYGYDCASEAHAQL